MKSDKSLFALLVLSALLHLLAFIVIYQYKPKISDKKPETYMVDLQDIPPSQTLENNRQETKRNDSVKRRFPVETAPKGADGLDSSPDTGSNANKKPSDTAYKSRVQSVIQSKPLFRGEGILRKKSSENSSLAKEKLFPAADRLNLLEDAYRRKYREEVADGEAHFVNTDDIKFGSFLRRFETAVYGVWRYPEEAVRLGIEGMTPVRITFNRNGEIVRAEILESSGSRLLDEEVLRTLRKIGIVGGFPKGYDKDHYALIAFFHYGIRRGEIRSLR